MAPIEASGATMCLTAFRRRGALRSCSDNVEFVAMDGFDYTFYRSNDPFWFSQRRVYRSLLAMTGAHLLTPYICRRDRLALLSIRRCIRGWKPLPQASGVLDHVTDFSQEKEAGLAPGFEGARNRGLIAYCGQISISSMPHSTRSPGPAASEHCTRTRVVEPDGIVALASVHAALERVSPFPASVFQLAPSLVEYSTEKPSPESSPLSR